MTRYTAFLRAVNVGGRIVKKDELVAAFEGLGLEEVSTFLASGNVLFSSSKKAAALEREIGAALGTSAFVRSAAEVKAVAAASPFGEVSGRQTLHVGFLKAAVAGAEAKAAAALSNGHDRLAVDGREVYWLIDGGFSEATVKDKDILRALGGVETTWRNMNTVRRLAEKL